MTSILFIIAIIAGFAILIWGADQFVDGAANLATNLGVSPLMVGLTVVGSGTSAPEILVSALAAFDGAPDLGIGNAIGSNIANIGLVLGVTTLFIPLLVHSDTLKREFPLLILIMALSLLLLLDKHLGLLDGSILFSGFILTLIAMTWLALRSKSDDPLEQEFVEEYAQAKMSTVMSVVCFLIGLFALLAGSKSLVWGATGVAHLLGISDLIIGLTIVSIGTSLPELASCVASALKNEHDIAVGNVIGSNMFNLLAVLAVPGLIAPSHIDKMVLTRDFPFMVVLTLVLYCFARFSLQGRIGRGAGLLMLTGYIGYNGLLAYQNMPGI